MATHPHDAGVLLPPGTRLVHIGPPKTGTTSLQVAFHNARPSLEAQGVHYAGRSRHSMNAALAVTGRRWPGETRPPSIRAWHAVAREVRSSRMARVVLSSEVLSYASPDDVRRIVDDLGGSSIHVVVTLRPVARLLPSYWQQGIQNGSALSLDRWLESVFTRTNRNADSLRRHDRLIARWADVVGTANVTAVVIDEADHATVFRAFEAMLGLDARTLDLDRSANRSLTLPEIELLREFNRAFSELDLDPKLHARFVRGGATQVLKQRDPSPAEPRLELPAWAADTVRTISGEIVDGIRGSGVRVVGDLESLTHVPESTAGTRGDADITIPPEVAARLALGILVARGATKSDGRGPRMLARRLYRRAASGWKVLARGTRSMSRRRA